MTTPTSLVRKPRQREADWCGVRELLGGGGASRPPGFGSEPKLAVTPLRSGAQESGFLTSSQGIPEHI